MYLLKYKLILICLLVILSFLRKQNQKENFDFTGVQKFWEVIEILQNDLEPTDEIWNELFETPGYKEFTSREMSSEKMKNYIRLAAMPSKSEELMSWINENNWEKRFPLHFKEVIKNRNEIDAFIVEINKDKLIDESLKLAKQYFPEGSELDPNPPISFLFFDSIIFF